jgi:hypothetical protein
VLTPVDPDDRVTRVRHRRRPESAALPDYVIPLGRTIPIPMNGAMSRLAGPGFETVVRGRDLRSVVRDMQSAVAKEVAMPPGYAISWSGQFEYLERAAQRLKVVVPATLAVTFVLLYLLFRSARDAQYFISWIDRLVASVQVYPDWNSEAEKQRTLEMLRAARAEFERRATD